MSPYSSRGINHRHSHSLQKMEPMSLFLPRTLNRKLQTPQPPQSPPRISLAPARRKRSPSPRRRRTKQPVSPFLGWLPASNKSPPKSRSTCSDQGQPGLFDRQLGFKNVVLARGNQAFPIKDSLPTHYRDPDLVFEVILTAYLNSACPVKLESYCMGVACRRACKPFGRMSFDNSPNSHDKLQEVFKESRPWQNLSTQPVCYLIAHGHNLWPSSS